MATTYILAGQFRLSEQELKQLINLRMNLAEQATGKASLWAVMTEIIEQAKALSVAK